MPHRLNLEGGLNSETFADLAYEPNKEFAEKCKTAKKEYELLTEVDVAICCSASLRPPNKPRRYFETTIQVRDYGGDLACYLGNTDISNELSYGVMEQIVGDNQ